MSRSCTSLPYLEVTNNISPKYKSELTSQPQDVFWLGMTWRVLQMCAIFTQIHALKETLGFYKWYIFKILNSLNYVLIIKCGESILNTEESCFLKRILLSLVCVLLFLYCWNPSCLGYFCPYFPYLLPLNNSRFPTMFWLFPFFPEKSLFRKASKQHNSTSKLENSKSVHFTNFKSAQKNCIYTCKADYHL